MNYSSKLNIANGKKKTVYIISNIQSGGSKKYLNDIINHYTNVDFYFITNKHQLYNISNCMPYDILFIQQLILTDILPNDLLYIKQKFELRLIICIHDFYWFNLCATKKNEIICHSEYVITYHSAYLRKSLHIRSDVIELFKNSSKVIHPTKFTIEHYNIYFPKNNTVLVNHNDYFVDYKSKLIPKIINNTINIGNIQELSEYKGSENVIKLFDKYTYYKGYIINFKIVDKTIPKYIENEWHNTVINHNLHCLLHLNKFGETHSYALTKSINSGLPILYNNIGCFKERLPNHEHYKYVIDAENDYDNYGLLFKKFEEMLDYIIINNGLFNLSNYTNKIIYNEFYDFIFEENKNFTNVI